MYVKAKLKNGKKVKVEITDKNVYEECEYCGASIPINIYAIFEGLREGLINIEASEKAQELAWKLSRGGLLCKDCEEMNTIRFK